MVGMATFMFSRFIRASTFVFVSPRSTPPNEGMDQDPSAPTCMMISRVASSGSAARTGPANMSRATAPTISPRMKSLLLAIEDPPSVWKTSVACNTEADALLMGKAPCPAMTHSGHHQQPQSSHDEPSAAPLSRMMIGALGSDSAGRMLRMACLNWPGCGHPSAPSPKADGRVARPVHP